MFKKIIDAVKGFFTKDLPKVEQAFTTASGFVNVIKTFEGSITGKTLIALANLVFPGEAAAVIAAINVYVTTFGHAAGVVEGAVEDIAATGINTITALTGDAKILALSNIASVVGNAASGDESTLQQAIVAMPVVYNPNVLATPVDTKPTIVQAIADANRNTEA